MPLTNKTTDMEDLKKYQNRVNAVTRVIYGRDAKHLPVTVQDCISLLKHYEQTYNVTY